jgi:hypothetical protein
MNKRHSIVFVSLAALAFVATPLVAGCKKVEATHVGACTARFQDLPPGKEADSPVKCTCSAADTTTGGSVWGSETYTDDSSVCRAAVHAGVIGSAGGDVTVTKTKGCSSYESTTKNGVTTSAWGSHPSGSFYFTSNGYARCLEDRARASTSAKPGSSAPPPRSSGGAGSSGSASGPRMPPR